MRPGDLRTISPHDWGECYLCRHHFPLGDLFPVRSNDAADWRYICPLCRDVARLGRPSGETRALIWARLRSEHE